MTKLLFLHNTAKLYRIPFFNRLGEIYDVKFIFTNRGVPKDVNGVYLTANIKGIEGLDYKILENSSGGIMHGLLKEKELSNGDYDIIIDSFGSIELTISFIVSKFRRKPIIFWSETWDWKKRMTLKNRTISFILAFIASRSNAIIVPGTVHKKYFISLGVPQDNIFIMKNASNICTSENDCINKMVLKEKLNASDKKVVLYVGRLIKRKGVEYLIKAFSKIRVEFNNTILIIVGDGECRGELEYLAKTLQIEDSVYFMGYVEDALLSAYYLLSNICVIPSINHGMGDPWVFVVNEAMYFGKPIIATDAVGAAFDMIKDGENGYIIPEKDSDALYRKMKYILSDPILEIKMGEESKRIVENGFTYENMIEGFRKAISYSLKENTK